MSSSSSTARSFSVNEEKIFQLSQKKKINRTFITILGRQRLLSIFVMVLLNPLAAPFTPSDGLPPPPPWPPLSCSSLPPSIPSYTLHDLILVVITAYKQGLIDASSPSIALLSSPSSLPSLSVVDSSSSSTLPHTSTSLSPPIQQEISPSLTANTPTLPTIPPTLDYSSLIDSLSLGKSGYPLVAPSKSHSSSAHPSVKPCISSGTIIQHNRKTNQRPMKLRSQTPKKITISPNRPLIPSPRIIRPSLPSPIPTHNRFDTISIIEEGKSTDFALALLQPLINQAINDAENKSVVQSVLTDICDCIVSNIPVIVDTPSIHHPIVTSVTNKKQKKSKCKKIPITDSASPIIDASSPTVPSAVDINLASISTTIDSNINEAEKLSSIEEKVEENVEGEMKENPMITIVHDQPLVLSSSQTKKLKKKNKQIKKEVVNNRTRNIARATRRNKKQEKELEGLTQEETEDKLREILAGCAKKRGYRSDDDADGDAYGWYEQSCHYGEEDLMAFGNGW